MSGQGNGKQVVVVLYATKYGSTREYAEAIGAGLDARVVPVERVTGTELLEAGLVVLGSPIYGPSILPAMGNFIAENRESLPGVSVAVFVVAGDTTWNPRAREGGVGNIRKFTKLLPHRPIAEAIFGGRLRMEELDAEDCDRILAFYARLEKEPRGFDLVDLGKVGPFVEQILCRGGGLGREGTTGEG